MRTAALRNARLVFQAFEYELRKVAAFRAGFFVREVLYGLSVPFVMIFVYVAILDGPDDELAEGWSQTALIRYMILIAVFRKLLFHEKQLDLSVQIFEGYVTKYLVMPFRYFVLPFARFLQHATLQLAVAAALWTAGALLLPGTWPLPVSAAAAFQALVLVLLGSYCFFLTYFILNCLAFWLDVVWSLLNMCRFVTLFIAGEVMPVAIMPAGLRAVFVWLYPYWALSAPVELYLGRLDGGDFLRGLLVLSGSILGLELLRRWVWRRGVWHYGGSGM